MQDVFHASDGPDRHVHVGEVAFHEVDAPDVLEVAPFAGDQTVGDTHAMAAPDQLLREVRSDEARAAGDEVGGHATQPGNAARGRPGVTFSAFW